MSSRPLSRIRWRKLLDEPLVPVVARADEEVVGDVEAGGERPPRLDDPVGVLLGLEALLGGDARDLRRVLVDAGEEERLTPALPLMARHDVRCDRRVRVPDVRGRVDVVDRRRDVVRAPFRSILRAAFPTPATAARHPRANAATSGPSGRPPSRTCASSAPRAAATTSADGARIAILAGPPAAADRSPGDVTARTGASAGRSATRFSMPLSRRGRSSFGWCRRGRRGARWSLPLERAVAPTRRDVHVPDAASARRHRTPATGPRRLPRRLPA